MSEPLLQVSDLATGYGDVQVLHDVDLTIGDGEVVAILGPNGHGKTTLLRTIAGLQRPWAGDVRLRGSSLVGTLPDRIAAAGCRLAPQGDLLFGDLTVEENLLAGAYARAAWRRRAERLDFVWSLFPQIADRRRAHAHALSGGERRMTSIGRALMASPELLMVDEPSLGLAPVAMDALYAGLAELRRHGMAVLLVEEMADRAGELADRMSLLDTGRIVAEGRSEDVLNDANLMSTYLG